MKIAADGAAHDTASIVIDGKTVTILAEAGSKLDRDGDGPILDVRSANADVSIFDLTISGATGVSGADGIQLTPNGGSPRLSLTRAAVEQNQGNGISVSGGTLVVSQTRLSGNTGGGITITGGNLTASRSTIALNPGGGVSISNASFDLTNNIIASNGGGGSTFGGLKIDNITGSGTRRIEFNTITANQAPATVNTGISCGTVLAPLIFSNNIIYGNLVAGGGKQLGGSAMCAATYSDIGPDASSGTGNITTDPMFVNPTQADFHLMSGSPCKDTADPAASLSVDIDGDARPQGNRRDVGADEYKP